MRLTVAVIAGALTASLFAVTARAQETVTIGGVNAVLHQAEGRSPPAAWCCWPAATAISVSARTAAVARGGNQLVRTRERLRRARLCRAGAGAGVIVAAAVKYMAAIKRPVTLVGTSRGTQRAAEGLAQGARPDALVLTSGFLSPQSGEGVHRSVIALLGSPAAGCRAPW